MQKSLINKQIPSNYVVQSAVIKKRDALSVGQPANPSPTCSCARFGHYSEMGGGSGLTDPGLSGGWPCYSLERASPQAQEDQHIFHLVKTSWHRRRLHDVASVNDQNNKISLMIRIFNGHVFNLDGGFCR